jgi:hypothetical protein
MDVIQVLTATLTILELASYPGKESSAIADLKKCLLQAIEEIHAAVTERMSMERPRPDLGC